MESTWVFTYWEAGDKVTRASSIPTEKVFGSLGKLGEWRPTNELNKAFVGGGESVSRVCVRRLAQWVLRPSSPPTLHANELTPSKAKGSPFLPTTLFDSTERSVIERATHQSRCVVHSSTT
jgi:hypothetical protein